MSVDNLLISVKLVLGKVGVERLPSCFGGHMKIVRKLRAEGKSWKTIFETVKPLHPEFTDEQIYHKIRYEWNKIEKTDKADIQECGSVEYKDGFIISDKFITVQEGVEMTPEYILQAHGLKVSEWEVVSYKNNFWNSQIQGGTKQISYQSKVTVKPQKNRTIDFAAIDEHFKKLDRTYKAPIILPKRKQGKLIAEVNIADLHIGKLCWWGDTGNNYDYKIAKQIYQQIISDVCQRLKGRDIEKIIFPLGNDLVNSDTPEKTTTHGTPQDTDIRWQKLQDVTTEMVIQGIDLLRQIAPVEGFYVCSNHDEVTTYSIVSNVKAWYRQDKDVTIDKSPMPRKYFLYGNTLVGYSHGSNEKPYRGTKDKLSKLAALMPVESRKLWAQAKYAEFHAAHLHSEHAIEEINGVIVRRVSAPAATDTWHNSSGYVGSVRKAQTFIYDKERGLVEILNTPV